VYGALGLISSLAPWWAGALQGRLVENLGVDQLAAYRFCAWLAENVRPDCTPDERIAGAVDDLELLVGLAHAQLERLGSALVREELVTDPQWLALQKHARELARVSDSFVRRSRWKWVADGAGGAS
jgi:hypothetical protein